MHTVPSDTKATEILNAQIERYDELENDIEFLSTFSNRGKRTVDMAGFIIYNDKEEACFSFENTKDKQWLAFFGTNPGYFSWIQQADFPLYTKRY